MMTITTLEQVLDALKAGHGKNERAILNLNDALNSVMRQVAEQAREITDLQSKNELLVALLRKDAQ